MTQLQRASATAMLAYSMAKKVNGMVNAEKKFFDNNLNPASAVDAAAGLDPVLICSAVSQGDTVSTRDGAKIRVKSLQVKGEALHLAAGASVQRIRLIGIVNKVMDGDFSTTTKLLAAPATFNSFLNIITSRNFTVLFDRVYTLRANDAQGKNINIYKKLDLPVKYILTTNVELAGGHNAIHIYAFSDQASNFPTIELHSRIRYYDN